ncbi:MAG TPA: hypothetical protein VGY56_10665 [Verrucomicrobiae bacterium]|nr:hypothetical protein [Verrucomicrobiae bacterium]
MKIIFISIWISLTRGRMAVALANDTNAKEFQVALSNDAAIDDDGWALIAPYGRHPKTRLYKEGNEVKEQKFIQVLDNEAADSMLAVENSFFRKLKRAFVGIPVYKLHGDLKDHDPKSAANVPSKNKVGVIDKIRKGARGIEAHFALDNEGADAVAEGCKFPSALWLVLPNGMEGDSIIARPFKLLSVGLTPFPNISGVESLANSVAISAEKETADASALAHNKNQNEKDSMKIVAGYLIGLGATSLANNADPNENQIVTAIQSVVEKWSGKATALENDKSTLNGNVTTLTVERDAHKKRADEGATALANEQTARKADRKSAATAIVDSAIKLGIKTVAERDAAITALENSTDFGKDGLALLSTTPTHKTDRSGLDISGRQAAALSNEQTVLANEYDAAFKAEIMVDQNPTAAHNRIMTLPKYKGLAEKLVPKA